MHVIEAEEVENLDFGGLSCRPAHWSTGSCQVARRRSDHVILSLGLPSGHGNAMSVNPSGWTRSPQPGSPERGDPFTSQAVIKFACFALQTSGEPSPGPWIGGLDPPAFPSLRQPEPLIRVVTAPKSNLARAVVRQHALGHFHREERAQRQIIKPFVVRQLINDRAAMPQDPKLRRGRDAVDIVDAEAQRPEFRRKPDQSRDKL